MKTLQIIFLACVALVGRSNAAPSDIIINIHQSPTDPHELSHPVIQYDGKFRDDYVKHGGSYYKYHVEPMPWGKAKDVCDHEGAHLAIANSEEEAHYYVELMKKFPESIKSGDVHNLIHLGFHDLFNEGQYVTLHDHSLESTGYYRWDHMQPSKDYNGEKEHCGSMFLTGLLNDIVCFKKAPFICEKEIHTPCKCA